MTAIETTTIKSNSREGGYLVRKIMLILSILTLGFVPAAAAEDLPGTAKKATLDEFKAFVDKKPVNVVIYDMDVQVTATLTWDWKKHQVSGNAVVNGKHKIKVKTKISSDGDKACTEGDDNKIICHNIYIEGNRFYEVRDDGVLHATSTLVQ
ncbi:MULTISPECIES: hypothetical protein [unclassified Mesorhizobium]|uniref:hypothetical protein n=1 Tax=unclassified Mesorhizobium TaxID=325217 RepID=UPI001FDFC700|nr:MULTISPECIES: hypothetical protein [unclassified Mesorhizobium]